MSIARTHLSSEAMADMEFTDNGDDEVSFTPTGSAKGSRKSKSKSMSKPDVITEVDEVDGGFDNPFFDDGNTQEELEEPVGHRVLGPGEIQPKGIVFDEDEMAQKHFDGRARRQLSKFIMAFTTIGLVLFFGSIGHAFFGDSECIDESLHCDAELERSDQACFDRACSAEHTANHPGDVYDCTELLPSGAVVSVVGCKELRRDHLIEEDGYVFRTSNPSNLPRACTLYNDLKPCGIGTGGYTNCENGCLSDGAPNCWCALNSGCDAGCSGENFSQRVNHWYFWVSLFLMVVNGTLLIFFSLIRGWKTAEDWGYIDFVR